MCSPRYGRIPMSSRYREAKISHRLNTGRRSLRQRKRRKRVPAHLRHRQAWTRFRGSSHDGHKNQPYGRTCLRGTCSSRGRNLRRRSGLCRRLGRQPYDAVYGYPVYNSRYSADYYSRNGSARTAQAPCGKPGFMWMQTVGPNLLAIFIVFILIYWVGMARITRSQVLVLKESDYVMAARALGANSSRIIKSIFSQTA